MVTLKDIARDCGVSIASVSKAINFMPGLGIDTAKRIRAAARRMGYVPNAAARLLQAGRSLMVGVLLGDEGLRNPFYAGVFESFRAAMEEEGYDLMLLNRRVGKLKVSYLEHVRHSGLDGVFVASADFDHPMIKELARADIPLVSLDHTFKGRPSVLSNHALGIAKALRHAFSLGHRRLALISGNPNGVTSLRKESFLATALDQGLNVPEDYLETGRYGDAKATFEATKRLLSLPQPPTCILMPDERAAQGGLQAIRAVGLSVPEDVSLIAFDGLAMFKAVHPRLATVWQDSQTLGAEAARLLLECMDSNDSPYEGPPLMVPVRLLRGQTLAPPRES